MAAAITWGGIAASAKTPPSAQDRIGAIVRPATGTGRAVYAPLDRPIILPRFRGAWAITRGQCVRQHYTNRMDLQRDVAIVAGHAYRVREAYVIGRGSRNERDDGGYVRAEDFLRAGDTILVLFRSGETTVRRVNLRFSSLSARLIFEEVGKPRRGYVRCRL